MRKSMGAGEEEAVADPFAVEEGSALGVEGAEEALDATGGAVGGSRTLELRDCQVMNRKRKARVTREPRPRGWAGRSPGQSPGSVGSLVEGEAKKER